MRCSFLQLKVSFFLFGTLAFAGPLACSGDDTGDTGDTDETSASTAGTGTAGTSGTASTGDTGETSTGGDTGGMGDGVTDCTPPGLETVVCQAGQYCADAVFGECQNGCLSNDNCTSEQVCEKAGGMNVGSCQNTGSDGPTEEEFCTKLLACDPSGTAEECSQAYAGTNEACHQCIVDANCGDILDGSCDEDCGL